jgi:hypothetical protein
MIDFLMDGLLSWLGDLVTNLLTGLLDLLTASVFRSPDVTVLPQVQTIADRAALVVSSGFILAILTAGILLVTSTTFEVRYTAQDLAPRLLVGFVMSAFSVPLCSALIGIANAVMAAMVGDAVPTDPAAEGPTTKAINMAHVHVASALTDASNTVVAIVIGLLIVVLMFLLVSGFVVRVGVLIVLAGIAPVALACYALPYTQPAAQLWWRSLLGCLATPVLQAIAFSTGIELLTDPSANMSVFFFAGHSSDVLNLMLVVVVLWVTIKIPGLVKRYVTGGGSPNMMAIIVRTVLVQAVARRIPGLGRFARPVARGRA